MRSMPRTAAAVAALMIAQSGYAQAPGPCTAGGGFPCVYDGGTLITGVNDLVTIAGLSQAQAETYATPEAETATDSDTASDEAADSKAETKAERKARKAAEREAQKEAEREAKNAARKARLRAERQAARQAEKEAAAAAAAAARTPSDRAIDADNAAQIGALRGDPGKVETDTVAVEDVRRSDQDFDTAVTGSGAAAPKKSGGLSGFEKVLLLGLGAAVVGQVLKNGDEVVSNSGDRVVVRRDGDLRVLKDDGALLRRPGDTVRTEQFGDGSTRTIVTRPDGSQLVTIAAPDGRVMSRTRVAPNGEATVIFDDTQRSGAPLQLGLATESASGTDQDALRRALEAELADDDGRGFTLAQVRQFASLRALAPAIELSAIEFATGSAAIRPEEARALARIGTAITDQIAEDPRTVFLIEGHTDAVGDAAYNLALSDRRAETVALALTEYFEVPPENLVVQGYGESDLKVPVLTAEPANRRAVVRDITPLLRGEI